MGDGDSPDRNRTRNREQDRIGLDPRTAARRGAEVSAQARPGSGHGTSKGRSFGTDAGLIAGSKDATALVVGVGYPYLSDLAFGNVVADRVADWGLPDVAVADCSHTPIAAYQSITAGDYDLVVIVGARKRGDGLNTGTASEQPGTVHTYRPDAVAVPGDDLVERIAECAMGSNTVENVVVTTRALGAFPGDALIVDVEPRYDSWGFDVTEFSPPVADALEDVLDLLLDRLEAAVG
jgi:Ni,Fe-hydrogenase maturation factor